MKKLALSDGPESFAFGADGRETSIEPYNYTII